MVRLSPPLSWRTKPDPERPETVTPTVALTAALVQAMATVVTFAVAVPLPPVTAQLCGGFVGCVATVTAYAPPVAMEVAKVKLPLALTGRLSAPLSWRTSPVPVRPVTVPPIVKGPVPVPVPLEVELEGRPLHAAKKTEARSSWGLTVDLMNLMAIFAP